MRGLKTEIRTFTVGYRYEVVFTGGSGAAMRWNFMMIGAFCDCIAWMDIFIKVFVCLFCIQMLLCIYILSFRI